MVTRIGLLLSLAWVVTLTDPIFTIIGRDTYRAGLIPSWLTCGKRTW